MLEIIIMLGVIGWFYRTARDNGRNRIAWAAFGAASYYVPVILVTRFILPPILIPMANRDNVFGLDLLNVAVGVAIGIACCVALRRWLAATTGRERTEKYERIRALEEPWRKHPHWYRLQNAARNAGWNVVVSEDAIVLHRDKEEARFHDIDLALERVQASAAGTQHLAN